MTVRSQPAPRDPPLGCILVVDDDANYTDVVRKILEDEGYRGECAADGGAALHRLLRGPPPDLILVDLMMPLMDGSRLIAELKARPELAVIPVVVVSGGGQRMLYNAPVSAGYLEKPITRARLVETLAACLARRDGKRGSRPSGG